MKRTTPTPLPASVVEALVAAAGHEQVAAYGYGTLGPRLSQASDIALARACAQAHQQAALSALALVPTPPTPPSPPAVTSPPDYRLPVVAVDDRTAYQLAIALEQACAGGWRFGLAQLAQSNLSPVATNAAASIWTAAVAQLCDTAVRGVRWRRLSATGSPSVAFPGISSAS